MSNRMDRGGFVQASALLLGILLACECSAASIYNVTAFPLRVGLPTNAGLNNAGQYIINGYGGGYRYNSYGPGAGQPMNVGALGVSMSATAINNAGMVAGSAIMSDGSSHAFVAGPDGVSDLGRFRGGQTTVTAINDSGQVIGYSEPQNQIPHAFLYSNGRMTDLSPSTPSVASAINQAGQVVGYTIDQLSYGPSPVLFDPSKPGGVINLNPLAVWGQATGINNSGQITGSASERSDQFAQAFVYKDGVFQYLANPAGLRGSWANAINNQGQIVGSAFGTSQDSLLVGFVALNGTMVDLNSFLPAGSLFRIENALAINDLGQILATGRVLGGTYYEGFILTPDGMPAPAPAVPLPEPTLLAFAGAVALAVGIRKLSGRALVGDRLAVIEP